MTFSVFCLLLLLTFVIAYTSGLNVDDQSQEFATGRCYSKCLRIFIRFKTEFKDKLSKTVITRQTSPSTLSNQDLPQISFLDEMAQRLAVNQLLLRICLEDTENQCSRQCFKTCTTMSECICQQNDIGCLLACYFGKENSREGIAERCPFISNADDNSLKISKPKCPKSCKSKSDCKGDEQCCTTDECGSICMQLNLPKYTPIPTPSSTLSNIEFDWSNVFANHLKNESPLVFILQTRTCLCNKFVDKFATPWQTLLMTHRLGAKLNALDNGTIYQFRLAGVTPQGTNGFGAISQNLPYVISRPATPFPPENLLEYKWQITDENLFKVEIRWDEPKPSSWRHYEFLLNWMIDHGELQSGEPMSSLTQYTKVLSGSDHHTLIENLRPSTTYKIQIVTKTDWPGYGEILSEPRTIYVTTPATSSSDYTIENSMSNSESRSCSCSANKLAGSDIRIRDPIISNNDLQVTIDMGRYSDYSIDIYPEVCINYFGENVSKSLNRIRRFYKQTSEITLESLQFNCRYALEVTGLSQESGTKTHRICFCTPPCKASFHGKTCLVDDVSFIPSPKEVKFSLFNYDTMTYKISWTTRNSNILTKKGLPAITRYRIHWAPRKFEPVPLQHYNGIIGFDPIFDLDRSDVRIIHSNITRLLLHNLTREQLYIVRIQSIVLLEDGQSLESSPITIFLPTHGYSDSYDHNSQRCLNPNRTILIIFLRLMHQIFQSTNLI